MLTKWNLVLILGQEKIYVCLRSADRPNFLAPTLNFFMALLVENYLSQWLGRQGAMRHSPINLENGP